MGGNAYGDFEIPYFDHLVAGARGHSFAVEVVTDIVDQVAVIR